MLSFFMHLPFLYEWQLTGKPSFACLPPSVSVHGWCLCRSSPTPSLHARVSVLLGTRVNREEKTCGHGGVWLQDEWSGIVRTLIPAC